jgi:hypothetical protein
MHVRHSACLHLFNAYIYIKNKLRGISPQANYTDRATAACRQLVPTFADRGVAWSAQRILTTVFSVF